MLVSELVGAIATTFRRLPPNHYLTDPERLAIFKMSFPRPDLLAWYDDEGGAALAPRDYAIGLLWRAGTEWLRERNVNRVVTCGRAEHLARLAPVRRPDDVSEIAWHLEDGAAPPLGAGHDVVLAFGWFEEASDLPALNELLRWDTANGLRIFVLSDATDRAAPGAAPGADADPAATLPGTQICRAELQAWPNARHVALCRLGRAASV